MTVKYLCRYCDAAIGYIDDDQVTEMQLGFHWLTPEERKDIISYDPDGQTTVRVVCESCQEMLNRNPELSLLTRPFQ
ncbi:MAG: anti-sigma-F factor Fin family protein [Firmicutes bacterium]|uniref:Anti-sigma-F factor Fin n=1 Tax=Melghirimyces thermohalophilus TaxID=1236220 RepID=A0A1G6Q0Y3_9BACL|nr:anti-sigma-F factor Fin family protein [Melghirimyces thermohalophilus]MDA8353125.1 anti-sigma-F factor Fin family protein [Bacillota bacterium]SDC86122.1 Protein of unknown function [Melghirimyces thermohalophilus]